MLATLFDINPINKINKKYNTVKYKVNIVLDELEQDLNKGRGG